MGKAAYQTALRLSQPRAYLTNAETEEVITAMQQYCDTNFDRCNLEHIGCMKRTFRRVITLHKNAKDWIKLGARDNDMILLMKDIPQEKSKIFYQLFSQALFQCMRGFLGFKVEEQTQQSNSLSSVKNSPFFQNEKISTQPIEAIASNSPLTQVSQASSHPINSAIPSTNNTTAQAQASSVNTSAPENPRVMYISVAAQAAQPSTDSSEKVKNEKVKLDTQVPTEDTWSASVMHKVSKWWYPETYLTERKTQTVGDLCAQIASPNAEFNPNNTQHSLLITEIMDRVVKLHESLQIWVEGDSLEEIKRIKKSTPEIFFSPFALKIVNCYLKSKETQVQYASDTQQRITQDISKKTPQSQSDSVGINSRSNSAASSPTIQSLRQSNESLSIALAQLAAAQGAASSALQPTALATAPTQTIAVSLENDEGSAPAATSLTPVAAIATPPTAQNPQAQSLETPKTPPIEQANDLQPLVVTPTNSSTAAAQAAAAIQSAPSAANPSPKNQTAASTSKKGRKGFF